jgi:hypothetical protein
MRRAERVLILGSAPDVLGARDWPRDGIDSIVAINNAFAVRPDWDFAIHSEDFPPERRPAASRTGQGVVTAAAFVPAVNAFGGFVFAGGTMAFTAGYWALAALRPRLIGFFGCDMVYPAAGASHFYGRGAADPLRPDPTLQSLEAKSARLRLVAAAAGCAVVNLSEQPASRLTFPRMARGALSAGVEPPTLLSARAAALAEAARAAEARLGYEAPDGRYWRVMERFDPAALRAVDALWLDAARGYAAAA